MADLLPTKSGSRIILTCERGSVVVDQAQLIRIVVVDGISENLLMPF